MCTNKIMRIVTVYAMKGRWTTSNKKRFAVFDRQRNDVIPQGRMLKGIKVKIFCSQFGVLLRCAVGKLIGLPTEMKGSERIIQ